MNVPTVLCRYDAMVSRTCDLRSEDMVPSVAEYSSVGNLSHTKQCITHSDLSPNVTSVCGVLLSRIQGTGSKVWK